MPREIFGKIRKLCDDLNPELDGSKNPQTGGGLLSAQAVPEQEKTDFLTVLASGILTEPELVDAQPHSTGLSHASITEHGSSDALEEIESYLSQVSGQAPPDASSTLSEEIGTASRLDALLDDPGTGMAPDPTPALEEKIDSGFRYEVEQSHRARNWTLEQHVFRGKGYKVNIPADRADANVTFGHLRLHLTDWCEDLGNRSCIFFIDVCDPSNRHPRVFAEQSLDTDPGKSIALNIVSAPDNDATFNFWPSSTSEGSVFSANLLADQILEGLSSKASLSRDRRAV